MSAPSGTLDASQSSTTTSPSISSTVPRGSSSLHRPLTSAVVDSCATSTNPGSPSTYSVTNVTTPSLQGRIESTNNAGSSGTVVEFPVDLQYAHLTSNAAATGQSQYCRLPSNNSATVSNILPAAGSATYQGSIVVPVTTQDPDSFVVTVRNSPNKIGKSSSSSFISKHSSGGLNSCTNNKTGPRLALYRSNSSLDLLDRDNYYLHHQRASIGTGKLTGTPGGHHHSHYQQQHFDRSAGVKLHSKGDSTYTGCFTRRKDFGSHGSIDVLPLTGGVILPNNSSGGSVSGNGVGTSGSSGKNERSSSRGNTTTGHFLSLVTSAMSRDRRGSFDIHDDGCSGGGGSSSSTISKNSGNKETVVKETSSPRLSLKFQKLWEHKDKNTTQQQHSPTGSGGGVGINTTDSSKGSTSATATSNSSSGKSSSNSKTDNSIFRKFRTSSSASRNNGNSKSLPETGKFDTGPLNAMSHVDNYEDFKPVQLRQSSSTMEERYRRRVFAHYDCQSVSAKISSAAMLRNILAKRRNTTTGASAASLGHRPVSTPPSASLNNIAGVAPAVNNSSGGQQLSLNLTGNGNNNGGSGNSSGGGGNNSENSSLDLVPSDDPDMGDGHSNALVLR